MNAILALTLWVVMIGNLLGATIYGITTLYQIVKDRDHRGEQYYAILTTMHLGWSIMSYLLLTK